MNEPREDLTALPLLQYRAAVARCGACLPFHALWPYLRVARRLGGVEADEPFLGPLLAELIGSEPRHIVLSGSADSGVLAMLHRAALPGGATHRFTLVDQCSTPFEAARAYAHAHGLQLTTLEADIGQMPSGLAADLIFGHSLLPFLAPHHRLATLQAMNSALAAGGRVVQTARVFQPERDGVMTSREPGEMAGTLLRHLTAGLADRAIPLPCAPQDFEALVAAFVQADSMHVAPYEQPDEIRLDLERAGLAVERLEPLGLGNSLSQGGRVMTVGRRGFVAISAPKRPCQAC